MEKGIKIVCGDLIFSQSNERIGGYVINGTEQTLLAFIIRKRSLPKLGSNFQPTGKRYELWEVCLGNRSWFVGGTVFDAQKKAIELFGVGITLAKGV